MCHQGGQTLRAGSTFEQERDQKISHLKPLKAGVRPRNVMALTSSKAVMTIMQSSRNMSWGLCLLLAGAVLVAGTSKSCAPRRTLFLANDRQPGSYIGIWPLTTPCPVYDRPGLAETAQLLMAQFARHLCVPKRSVGLHSFSCGWCNAHCRAVIGRLRENVPADVDSRRTQPRGLFSSYRGGRHHCGIFSRCNIQRDAAGKHAVRFYVPSLQLYLPTWPRYAMKILHTVG